MSQPRKQHLIDPEICIRCYTCEMTCPEQAILHDDLNVVVDAEKCNFCLDCIPVCPTGSIDEWRLVTDPHSVDDQLGWMELPPQETLDCKDAGNTDPEAVDQEMAALLAEAHKGAGGRAKAPASTSKPAINLYTQSKPATARVQGNYRLTDPNSDSDVRHIILDLAGVPFPVLEGQSIGIIPPGVDAAGKPHLPRLYSVSSPRDGERPGFLNISLTVKREPDGICSNHICDLNTGDTVQMTGPFGSTFLMPSDPEADILMICTGTGSAPFRGFTMRRQRVAASDTGKMTLVFGARCPGELPYFGPLKKIPDAFMAKHFAFSRQVDSPKRYVQDVLREQGKRISDLIQNHSGYIYICGLKAMEQGVDEALKDIARSAGLNWQDVRDRMRDDGRYHVETY